MPLSNRGIKDACFGVLTIHRGRSDIADIFDGEKPRGIVTAVHRKKPELVSGRHLQFQACQRAGFFTSTQGAIMQATLDNAPTEAELDRFHGRPMVRTAADEIREILTVTVRKVPASCLSLPYVRHGNLSRGVCQYPLAEAVKDYGTEPAPLAALMAVLERSDCPLVQAYRVALSEQFEYANADEVDMVRGGV